MIKNFQKIAVHAPTEISDIKFAGPCQDSIVCAGRRFILKVLDASTFETTRENQLIQSELTALQVGQDHIWVGTGNGRLLQLNPKDLSILSSKQLHKDCISGILETGNEFVTIGFDGLVNFIDKRNEGVFRSLYVDSPPKQILKFKDQYYLAGVKSYRIDKEYNIQEFGRYDQFLDVQGRLFGTNDIHGLTYISMKDKKYVPSERIVAYKDGLLGTSWETATYFMYDSEERISWKSARVYGFERGDSITSLLSKGRMVYGGAESGNMYVFSFDQTYSIID